MQGRGGKGILNLRVTAKTGEVIAVRQVGDEDEVILISQEGKILRTPVASFRVIGRSTQGVKIMDLEGDDRLVAAAKLVEREEDDVEEVEEMVDAPTELEDGEVGDEAGGTGGDGGGDAPRRRRRSGRRMTPPQPPAAGPPPDAGRRVVRAAWIFYLVLGLAAIVWLGSRRGRIPLSLFVDPATWWLDLALGLATGAALLAAWAAGARWLPAARQLEDHIGGLLGPLGRDEVIALAVLSGVAEELFFRGAVQGAWGWGWATALFAVLHTGPGLAFRAWTAFAALAGAGFGGLVVWRGTLLAPIVAHILVNAVNLDRLARRAAAGAAARSPAEAGSEDGGPT